MFVGFLKKLYVLFFRCLGWKIYNQKVYDGIYIVPTHTSLWDAPIGLALVFNIIANPIVFLTELWYDRFPGLFRFLNFIRTPELEKSGISSYASFFRSLKKEVKEQYKDPRALGITVCPEGQLGYCEYWKPGFLHLSKMFKLPIYIVKIDYRNKEVCIINPDDPIVYIGRKKEEVMDEIRNLVDPNWAKYPENVGRIRLKTEGN